MKHNTHLDRLKGQYLFYEISQRKQAFLESHPDVNLISLGIGDVSQPIPSVITDEIAKAAHALSTPEGFSGYGPSGGLFELRKAISTKFYSGSVQPDEVFISDGGKCDLGRLQLLFDSDCRVAVQDPTYPVYVDTSLMSGKKDVHYLPCTPQNDFFPDLNQAQGCDLLFFCSPNNPTGNVATYDQLEDLVSFARRHGMIIIFDAAYSAYIQDPSLPKSIFEVEGAREVAIEINSFSKVAGFTGVRLGWSVVPSELRFRNGSSVKDQWQRVVATFFNGASNLVQLGGLAVLEDTGWEAVNSLIQDYLENARLLRDALQNLDFKVYGGDHAPYLWVDCGQRDSWKMFDYLMERAQIISIPGVGFGPAGEGFIRLSAFTSRSDCNEAVKRIRSNLLQD